MGLDSSKSVRYPIYLALAGPVYRRAIGRSVQPPCGRASYKVDERLEAKILAWTTKRKPADGSTHWSSRKLACELGGVSHMTVSRVWAKHALKPHRIDRYMASTDPEFAAKAADMIGLYLNPPACSGVLRG